VEVTVPISAPCGQGALRGRFCYGSVTDRVPWLEVEGEYGGRITKPAHLFTRSKE